MAATVVLSATHAAAAAVLASARAGCVRHGCCVWRGVAPCAQISKRSSIGRRVAVVAQQHRSSCGRSSVRVSDGVATFTSTCWRSQSDFPRNANNIINEYGGAGTVWGEGEGSHRSSVYITVLCQHISLHYCAVSTHQQRREHSHTTPTDQPSPTAVVQCTSARAVQGRTIRQKFHVIFDCRGSAPTQPCSDSMALQSSGLQYL
jgi:hypothetical protein